MSAYVDPVIDHGWRLGPSCHLIADTLEELHLVAEEVGCRREWFQPQSFPHYDLTKSRRAKAIRAGAIPLDRKEFVGKMRELRDRRAQ